MYNLLSWVAIGVIALVIDLVTSMFLFVWFTAGAIAAIIAYTLGCSLQVQIIVFVVTSFVLMAIGYPIVKRTIKKSIRKTPTMEQNYIGRQLKVDEEIVEKATIKLDGIYWTIKNVGEPIKRGDEVTITGLEGNKLLIRKK